VPASLEVVSVGRRLENVAINAARWNFDSASGKGSVYLRIQNLGRSAANVEIRGRNGQTLVFRKSMPLAPQSAAALETEVAGGLGVLRVEIAAAEDGLPLDNHVDLVEPEVRTVTAAITLPGGAASRLVRKVLDVLPNVQYGDVESANLVVAPGGILPESNPRVWWLGFGPLSAEPEAAEQAKDLAGPYLLDKRNPLLDGVVLGGVVWGGVQPTAFDLTPLVSAGNSILFGRLTGTRTVAHLMNIDLARSNLGESPDWPILLTNLIEQRRDSLPGLQRWNYRLGEEVRFRLFEGEIDPAGDGGGPLTLEHAGRSRQIARSGLVELTTLDETGVYEVKDGTNLVGRFAVNFFDPEESDLTALVPGKLASRNETPIAEVTVDNPYSWPILLGLAVIAGLVIADWYVLQPGNTTNEMKAN
jgi:Ca-activated chloride channel homolog